MRGRVFGAVCVALAVAALGCKKGDDNKAEAEPATEKPAKKGYLDRGLSMGKSALNKAESAGESAIDTTKDLAHKAEDLGLSAYRKTRKWGAASIDDVRKEALAIVKEVGGDMLRAANTINGMLDLLAKDPDAKVTTADRVARMIVLMVPVVGPTKRYIDARKLYQSGVARKDEARIQEARRETLIAFTEAGLDIGVLGLIGGKIDLVATGADKVLSLLKTSRKVSTLVGANLNTFDDLLDAMLRNAEIRDSVDAALTIDLAQITPG